MLCLSTQVVKTKHMDVCKRLGSKTLVWCVTEVLKSTDDLMKYLKMCDATPAPFGLFKHADKSKVQSWSYRPGFKLCDNM